MKEIHSGVVLEISERICRLCWGKYVEINGVGTVCPHAQQTEFLCCAQKYIVYQSHKELF